MNNIQMKIWGRDFSLDIYYKIYRGEEITDHQTKALECYINAQEAIDNSLANVVAYIEENYKEFLQTGTVDNIFKYVIPKTIYVSNDNSKRIIILLCDFRFDIEHGIGIVFEDEKASIVASQDELL